MLASRSGRTGAWAGLISGGGLATAATICWVYYPDDAEFAPLAQQGIITSAERIEARTEASTAGSTVIEAPPGSRCRILAPRGPWTYVEFANLTRGWLPTAQVSNLVAPAKNAEKRL